MILSVSQFLTYVNETLKAIWDAQAVAIEGEVSGFRVSQGQWVNFDVKDEEGLLGCFMVLPKLKVPLQDGMRVRLYGTPKVFTKYGKFSFTVDRVELVGEGALRKALAQLKERLTQEGLFDPRRKRALPKFPQHIALIASRESAAYGDFLRILEERWPGLTIDVYHVLVQGESAPASLVRAIKRVSRAGASVYDAVVMTRGGGSFEELMAFNDESVVRALYGCSVPTLVGIGHERDVTLAEEVADVRGSTPTDCARRLVGDRSELLFELSMIADKLQQRWINQLRVWQETIARHEQVRNRWLELIRAQVNQQEQSWQQSAKRWYVALKDQLIQTERLLHSFDPTAVLRRGYAILLTKEGRALTRTDQAKIGEEIEIRLQDGKIPATIGKAFHQPSLFLG